MNIFKSIFQRKDSFAKIKTEMTELSVRIGADENMWPTFKYSEQSGRPHIKISRCKMHYIICERGIEFSRQSTTEICELLYWVFKDITFSISSDYELNHRIKNKDFRRMLFAKQEELLGVLSPDWQKLLKQEHAETLEQHPYNDL